jgi:hypothetical protein
MPIVTEKTSYFHHFSHLAIAARAILCAAFRRWRVSEL